MAEPTEKEPRGPVNLRIKFRSANLDEFIERYAVDVSRGGIFIRTREPLSVGTRLKLDFQLLEQGLLQGDGTVVWIRENDPSRPAVTPGMGVRFDQLTAESQPVLEKILSEKDRLAAEGKIPAMAKSNAGMAVRRPTGSFSTVEAMAARTGLPPLPDMKPPAPPETGAAPASLFPGAQFRTGAQPVVGAAPAAPVPASQSRSGPQSTGFGRPRSTTGMSTLRSAPAPQTFEPPSTEDIDKALSALEEAPGPKPFVPPPPPPPPDKPSRFAMSATPAPVPVNDDPSNEPTRVGGLVEEFGANDAVTGKASVIPDSGLPDGTPIAASPSDDLTARAPDGSGVPIAAQGEAKSTASRAHAAALDAPLAAHLDTGTAGGPAEKPVVIKRPLPGAPKELLGGESGQFRANATYRRPRSKVLGRVLLALAVLGGGAGAVYKLKLLDRLRTQDVPTAPAAPAPSTPVIVPVPAAPEPEKTEGEPAKPTEAKAGEAKPGEAKVGEAKPGEAKADEAKPQPAKSKDEIAKDEKEKAKAEKTKAAEAAADERAAVKRKRRREEEAAAAAAAKAPAAGEAAKPAEAAAPGSEPAKPAAAAEGEKPAAAAERPTLKITSSPSGADVIIDGNSVGTTPFTSQQIDATAPHGITVKKDGFEPQDRMIGTSDWAKGKLKVNMKLRRIAAPAAPKEESGGKASDVEIITPD